MCIGRDQCWASSYVLHSCLGEAATPNDTAHQHQAQSGPNFATGRLNLEFDGIEHMLNYPILVFLLSLLVLWLSAKVGALVARRAAADKRRT